MNQRIDLEPHAMRPTGAPTLATRRPGLARRCLILLALGCGALSAAMAQTPQLQLDRVRLQAGMHLIDAQLALTPQQRSVGLMWRREMPQNEGMLFAFEQAAVQCFWMKNTLLPLTAAFVADDGSIVNLADMQPGSEANHCSAQPVRFVLEMHQGWFAPVGIALGLHPLVAA